MGKLQFTHLWFGRFTCCVPVVWKLTLYLPVIHSVNSTKHLNVFPLKIGIKMYFYLSFSLLFLSCSLLSYHTSFIARNWDLTFRNGCFEVQSPIRLPNHHSQIQDLRGTSHSYLVTKNTRKLDSCVPHDTTVRTSPSMTQGQMLPELAHNIH